MSHLEIFNNKKTKDGHFKDIHSSPKNIISALDQNTDQQNRESSVPCLHEVTTRVLIWKNVVDPRNQEFQYFRWTLYLQHLIHSFLNYTCCIFSKSRHGLWMLWGLLKNFNLISFKKASFPMVIFSKTNLLKEEVDQFQILEKVFSNNLGVLRCLLFGLRWPWLSWSRLEDSPRSTSSRNWSWWRWSRWQWW